MHEGHHGILDDLEEDSHEHRHKRQPSSRLKLWKITGIIGLSLALIIFFRIIFN